MANTRTKSARIRRVSAREPALGPGLHAALVEMAADGEESPTYRVRTSSGALVAASPAPGVAPALIDECLRARRTVLCAERAGRVEILGALQTTPSPRADLDGNVALEGRAIEIAAAERIALKVGGSRLSLDRDGVIRMDGDRLTIDVGALVQILSANVRLP
jgi:hypothetical protein